jgi:NAD(P)-dependent dehydrogenase (short-subunit alcohol dehydrogenase family)
MFECTIELDLLKDETSIKSSLRALKVEVKPFSAFIACSGIQKIAPITSIRESDLNDLFQLNVFSNVFLIKNLLRLGMIADGASLVLMSSISAEKPDIGLSSYSMTKAAVDNFVKVAALELTDRSIRVNSIRPGMIQTPMILKERAYTPSFIENEMVKYKLGPGKPDDVADLVKFLVSDSSRWITGQNITLDGGRTLVS